MNVDVIVFTIFVLVAAVVGAFLVFLNMLGSPAQKTRGRLDRFKERHSPTARAKAREKRLLTKSKGTQLDQMIRDMLPRPAELRARLDKTGRDISLTQYSGASAALLVVSFLFLKFIGNVPGVLAIMLGLAVSIAGPHMIVGRMIDKRLNNFTSLFPEAIDLIVRGLRSGLPVNESMNTVGREIEDPVGVEFRTVGDAMRLGQTLDEALWAAAKRVDTPDFKFFVISLSVQKETGGNLAETLENLSDILRRRQQMKLKIRALSSEGRASAYIVGALPFIMFGIILTMNYDYGSVLFTDPRAITIIVGALMWMGLGVFIMGKMINFEV